MSDEGRSMDPELTRFRAELDQLDEQLISLLARRSATVRALWLWKAAHGLARVDAAREAALRARLLDRAVGQGLDRAAVAGVLDAVVGRDLAVRPG